MSSDADSTGMASNNSAQSLGVISLTIVTAMLFCNAWTVNAALCSPTSGPDNYCLPCHRQHIEPSFLQLSWHPMTCQYLMTWHVIYTLGLPHHQHAF